MTASRFGVSIFLQAFAFLLAGEVAFAQVVPVVDSVSVETQNIFDSEEAARSFLFRLTNGLHVTTQSYVVRRELLFRPGDPYDSARFAESERNLRAMGIFREVTIDTIQVGGRLVARVVTSDGWSTNLNLNARATGDVFTWSVGITEQNVLGTANMAGVNYRHGVDRNTLRFAGRINRAFGTRTTAEGFYDDLSDGRLATWVVGLPFRALSDRTAVQYYGETARRRVLRFRTEGGDLDTARFRRTALVQRGTIGWAPVASPRGYLRIGLQGQVRREEYVPEIDTALAIPDTVTGAVGVFAEWFHPAFQVVTHYNGFAREEDLDLSTKIHLAVWAVPSAFGYEQTGVVPVVELQTGVAVGKFFGRVQAKAHGQFSSAGLDSGQVWGGVTLGSRVIPRQATVLHVEAGAQENPVPGGELDLGHGLGPRAFAPHAFTGTRSIWGILEHRVFLIDDLLHLMGVGLAGFVDYGGAWYADQSARFGGNVGLGLRLGTTRSSGPNVGRLDLAYQFGEGVTGDRWVFSFGRSYEF